METAIDRLETGKEKEVNIREFDGNKKENRFVCPECGEYVFPKQGKRTCFSHHKKTGVNCERRVDGSASTYYERVGLPLYLKKENNHFSLMMGFYALGENLLKSARLQNTRVYIESGDKNRLKQEYIVDFAFFEEQITHKPISFIPSNGENYKISITSSQLTNEIHEIWSNFADGFASGGALFTYSESCGKKIRRNDTITTNTEYYMLSRRSVTYNGLKSEHCSFINLSGEDYEVRKIALEPEGESNFKELESYFWIEFRLKLLYKKPEIIPIWPPSVQCNDVYSVLPLDYKNTNVFCKIVSDCENQKVYRYNGKFCVETKTHKSKTGLVYAHLSIDKLRQPYTIDRKYLANAIILVQRFPVLNLSKSNLTINGLSVFTDVHNQSSYCIDNYKMFEVKSNLKLQIIKVRKYKALEFDIIINSLEKNIEISDDISEIWLYSETLNHVVVRMCRKNLKQKMQFSIINEEDLLIKIKPHLKEKTVFIPRQYSALLFNVKDYQLVSRVLSAAISIGKIQPTILKMLEKGGFFNEQ